MHIILALSCVAQDDVVSLRIVCTMARDRHDNLEQLDSYGNTALLKACYLGRFECARTILGFGGNIFAINYFGQNALTLATYAGHLPLVQELLRRRSYKDFNLSSLIPAMCVATVQKHADLEQFFARLDPNGVHETQTYIILLAGLGVGELRGMTVRAERLNPESPPTFIRHRLR
ncbi:hypothetical protein KR032_012092 [Drosophila birchii]|nr:hypothetical protein KR032_012092 [Drosophila birchii]